MGWTETNWVKGTKIIDWFREICNHENEKVKIEVLDAALVKRKHAYAAVQQLSKETGEIKVFAITALVSWSNRGYYNFCYKDMDESMGPYMYDCPERILDLLTPTEYEYAIEWRKKCREYHAVRKAANKKLTKFNVGDTVVFKHPIRFQSGHTFNSLQVISTKPLKFTDGGTNWMGVLNRYHIRRATLQANIKEVIPTGQGGIVKQTIIKPNKSKCPVYVDEFGKKHTILGWACGAPKSSWEWYATEINDDGICFGYVMGFENEWGSFSVQELNECGINLITDPDKLKDLAPPIGWKVA